MLAEVPRAVGIRRDGIKTVSRTINYSSRLSDEMIKLNET